MELQFHQPQSPHQQHHYQVPITKPSKLKGRNKISSNSKNKYVGVRQRPSGRWVAEIKDTTHKIRMWLGTFGTAEEAARAYDEAACLLRGSNTRTNFGTHASHNSPLASRIRMLLDHKKLKKSASHSTISFSPPTYHNSTITTTTATSSITSTITTTTTSNNINPSTSTCSSINFAVSNGIATATLCNGLMQDPQLTVNEVYRPYFINECDESQLASAQFDSSCAFGASMQIAEGCNMTGSSNNSQIAELDRIKMEREISASLSDMNELQDYFDMGHDPCDPWDLPPLCQLSCRSFIY